MSETAVVPQPLNVMLWLAQTVVAALFSMIGFMKLTKPISDLVAMQIKWAGEFPEWAVRGLGLIDLAGGIGILLPALTRVQPRLTIWAALGCTVLQLCAITFHVARGETGVIGLNLLLIALSAFVLCGRRRSLA